MAEVRSRRRDVVLLGAAAAASCVVGCGQAEGSPRVVPTDEILGYEHELGVRVNHDRAAAGLPPLTYDEKLADVARAHALDMQRGKFFAHDSPTTGSVDDRLDRADYLAVVSRENLAEAPTVPLAEEGLLASPKHHENLMAKDVTHLGVGIVQGGLAGPGNFLFVQVFARPAAVQTPAEARGTVLDKLTAARKARGFPAVTIEPALDELAASMLDDLPDDVPESALGSIGTAVLKELVSRGASGGSVLVTGARVIAASEYTPPPAATERAAQPVGLAVGVAKDDRGHKAMKVLLILRR